MKKKLLLNLLVCCISFGALAGTAPVSLSLKGSSLNESQASISMKKVDNTYELFTSLKTGNYSFEGDATIPEATVTVGENPAPYYIRVDYAGETPEVTVKKIERVILWAPWDQFTIGELMYDSNSTFKGERFTGTVGWGNDNKENRYRIKVFMEGDFQLTYQPANDVQDEAPNDDTPQSYYNMYIGPNDQWGGSTAKEYKISDKYYNTGKAFDVEVILKPTEDYTHKVTEHVIVSNLPLCDEIIIEGDALENNTAVLKKKDTGIFEFVGGMKAGNYKIKGIKDGATHYFSLQDNKLVENEADLTVEGDLKPYYLKVDLVNESLHISPVASLYLFYSSSGYAAENRILFNYAGNAKFTATATVVWPKASWDENQKDERYKFKMDLEDQSSVFWGYSLVDTERPTETAGDYYNLYSVNSDDYQYAFKFRDNTDGKSFNFEMIFATNGNFTHSYTLGGSGTEDTYASKVSLYPTVVEDNLTISSQDKDFRVEFISMTGISVLTADTNSGELRIGNINLPKGFYFVRIIQNEKTVSVQRIFKL